MASRYKQRRKRNIAKLTRSHMLCDLMPFDDMHRQHSSSHTHSILFVSIATDCLARASNEQLCDASQRDGHRCVAHTVSTNKTTQKKWAFQFEEIKHVPFRYIMSYWFSCLLFILLLFNSKCLFFQPIEMFRLFSDFFCNNSYRFQVKNKANIWSKQKFQKRKERKKIVNSIRNFKRKLSNSKYDIWN